MKTKEERQRITEKKKEILFAEMEAKLLEKQNHKLNREEINKLNELRKELDPIEDFENYQKITELIRINATADADIGKNEAQVEKAKTESIGQVCAAIIGLGATIGGIITASKMTMAPNLMPFIHKPKV